MVKKARIAPKSMPSFPFPLATKAKAKDGNVHTSTSTSSASSSFNQTGRPKKKNCGEYQPMELAGKRENHGCFLNCTEPIEMAHIYPNHLIHSHSKGKQSPLELWDLLKIFWGPKELASWQAELYWNPKDPMKAADTIKNLMCMGPEIHKMWCGAHFALRPLVYNDQRTKLSLE